MTDDERKAIEEQCETRAVEPHLVRALLAENAELRAVCASWEASAAMGEKTDAAVDKLLASLKLELEGERKAKELALKGLESVTELYDAKKHRVRELEAALQPFADWYARLGPDEISRECVGDYRRAAELLAAGSAPPQ